MNATESKIESILFLAGEPLPLESLYLGLNISRESLLEALSSIQQRYLEQNSGLRLLFTEQTAQLTTNPENASAVENTLTPLQRKSVSASLMETLAVIAYKQPVTRGEIEEIRGVRCEYALSQLEKLKLITVSGRKEQPGRPRLYVTTDSFLHKFRLHSLQELPPFPEEGQDLPELTGL